MQRDTCCCCWDMAVACGHTAGHARPPLLHRPCADSSNCGPQGDGYLFNRGALLNAAALLLAGSSYDYFVFQVGAALLLFACCSFLLWPLGCSCRPGARLAAGSWRAACRAPAAACCPPSPSNLATSLTPLLGILTGRGHGAPGAGRHPVQLPARRRAAAPHATLGAPQEHLPGKRQPPACKLCTLRANLRWRLRRRTLQHCACRRAGHAVPPSARLMRPSSCPQDFFGGLLIVTAEQFRRINGFGTQFWG